MEFSELFVLTCFSFLRSASNLRDNSHFDCSQFSDTSGMMNRCLPLDSAGVPLPNLALAPAGELDGTSAIGYSMEDMLQEWPYHNSLTNDGNFAADLFLLIDLRLLEREDLYLYTDFAPLMAKDALASQELQRAGVPQNASVMNTGLPLEWMSNFNVQFSPTLTIHLDGSERLEYAFETQGSSIVTQRQVERDWLNLLNVSSTSERSRLINLRAQPNITLLMSTVSYIPSFDLRVVREVQTYTLGSFFADLGQKLAQRSRELHWRR
jgi:hypothetical protein